MHLKLPSLAYRRLRGDMIELYKIATHKYDTDITEGMIKFSDNTSTRGNQYKIHKERARLKLRNNTFFFRTTENWNSLPDDVVCASTIHVFERRLDKFWANHPVKYDYLAHPTHPRMIITSTHQYLVKEADEA